MTNFVPRLVLCSWMLLVTTSLNAAEFPFLATVTSEKVNVRAGGNVNFEKLATLPKGTDVVVVGSQFDWYKVELPEDAKIYIRSDYIKLTDDSIAVVTGTAVNVRAGMSTTASVVGQLKKGDAVTVAEKINDWSRIKPMSGLYGWISKDFLARQSATIPDDLKRRYARPVPVLPATVEAVGSAAAKPVPVSTVVARVSVRGVLERLQPAPSEDIQYRITTADRKMYDLKSTDAPWGAFVHSVVGLEGTVVKEAGSPLQATVVQPARIELIL